MAMASSSITSQQREREKVETVTNFIFLGSKIIVDYSHENKRCFLFGRKTMTNLESIFKSRDITVLTKVTTTKAVVFPVVTYGCESWTLKKAECWRIRAFESWCWGRFLRVSRTEEIKPVNSKGNQHWKFIGKTDAEALTLWPADAMSQLIRKDPDARKDWRREKGTAKDEKAIIYSVDMSLTNSGRQWRIGEAGVLQSMELRRVGHNLGTKQQWVKIIPLEEGEKPT